MNHFYQFYETILNYYCFKKNSRFLWFKIILTLIKALIPLVTTTISTAIIIILFILILIFLIAFAPLPILFTFHLIIYCFHPFFFYYYHHLLHHPINFHMISITRLILLLILLFLRTPFSFLDICLTTLFPFSVFLLYFLRYQDLAHKFNALQFFRI